MKLSNPFRKFISLFKQNKGKSKRSCMTVDIGVEIKTCKDCGERDAAMQIYNAFRWGMSREVRAIAFDKETNTITVNKEMLMRVIRIANPMQQDRDIRLV